MNVTAKITSKGQVTIPRKIRCQLGVKAGDLLVFDYRNPEDIRVKKQPSMASSSRGFLKGKTSRADLPVSIDEMKEAIRTAANRGRFVS